MKFTAEDIALLKTAVNQVIHENPDCVGNYERGNFPNSAKVKDLQKRFCFDILYASKITIGDGVGIIGDINGEYNTDHIYTALKSVCPVVNRKY